MIQKEHLKTRLRKFLEEKYLGVHDGLCGYLTIELEFEDWDETYNYVRDWMKQYCALRRTFVDVPKQASPLRLRLAQKLLDELEAETPTENTLDGTTVNPNIN